jgi:hypothetical protein
MAFLNFDSQQAALESNAFQLAKILSPIGADPACWLPEDLPALLRHQWKAPLDFDLADARQNDGRKILTSAADSKIRTFADMLNHPAPSLPLLKLAKDFFKVKAGSSEERNPEQQIGYLFYLLVILSAKVRLRTSISSLSEAHLQKAVRWALGQTWVEGKPRNLLLCLYADSHPGTTTAQRPHK